MARQTRAQRRTRRAERGAMGPGGEAALPGGPPAPPPPARPTARASDQPQPDRERRVPGVQFVSESWGELKKVEWPTQKQIIQATVVVIVACAIVGVYLWAADLVFRPLVEKVFL